MRKIFTFLTAVLLTVQAFAQTPEKMSYQAVLRDNNNQPVANIQVRMQISILQGSVTGTPAYVETQTPTTNSNGLVSLEIGAGTQVTGTFGGIDWKNGPFFIKTETDLAGGTNYTITGTSQLLSVPFALHAKTAETIISPTYTTGLNSDLGGYVFYVTPDGKHGLVVTSEDLVTAPNNPIYLTWIEAMFMVNFPNYHNTDGKKFTDWRLPNYYEITLLKPLASSIGITPNINYWSSWDQNNNSFSTAAWFFSNTVVSSMLKTNNGRIRAVRSF